MRDLRSSPHFFALGTLPEFDSATPLRVLYSELYRKGASGFVVISADGTRCYVKGDGLATAVVWAAVNGTTEALRSLSNERVGRVLNRGWAADHVLHIPGIGVDLSSDPDQLQTGPDTVFAVMAADGRLVGWFLSHARVLETVTGKTVWMCENGHDNPDSDHGYCYSCPGGIVGARKIESAGVAPARIA